MDDKRNKILVAAFNIFNKNGFHDAKISEIAKEAEIGKGTVYEYFSSKQSLFEEMLIFVMQQYDKLLKAAIEEGNTPEEKLRIYIETEWQVRSEHTHIMELVISRIESLGENVKKSFVIMRKGKTETISKILSEGVKQGIFKAVNIDIFTLMISGTFNEAIFEYNLDCMLKGPDESRATNIKKQLIELFLEGLKS